MNLNEKEFKPMKDLRTNAELLDVLITDCQNDPPPSTTMFISAPFFYTHFPLKPRSIFARFTGLPFLREPSHSNTRTLCLDDTIVTSLYSDSQLSDVMAPRVTTSLHSQVQSFTSDFSLGIHDHLSSPAPDLSLPYTSSMSTSLLLQDGLGKYVLQGRCYLSRLADHMLDLDLAPKQLKRHSPTLFHSLTYSAFYTIRKVSYRLVIV